MKKLFLTMIVALMGTLLCAQPKIQFEKTTYDFGTIKEEGGKVTGKFIFKNVGNEDLTLVRVKPGCGCTAANYTKTPVKPGEEGFIEATYNPYGRPGGFNKVIRVTTNEPQFDDPATSPHNIFIKGSVTKRPPTVYEQAGYTQGTGAVRIKENTYHINGLNSEEITFTVLIRNFMKSPTTVAPKSLPQHITIKSTNFGNTLAPDQEGEIVFAYNPAIKNEIGTFKERIDLITQDSIQTNKIFFLNVNIQEDFSKYTPKQLKEAPIAAYSVQDINFDKVAQGTTPSKTVTLTNNGKNDLIIRQIKPSSNVFSTKVEKNILKKGESTTITITMNSRGRKGTHKCTIDVTTNDPVNTIQVIHVIGEQLP